MKKRNIENIYSLSPVQEGILFHTLYAPNSGVYCIQLQSNIKGELNLAAFKHAWEDVIDRHAILRTLFVWENRTQPLQLVRRETKMPWQEYDWRHLTREQQQTQLSQYLSTDRSQGFDLAQAPLMRLALFHLSENNWHLVWNYHHLLLDGWSVSLILKEVFTFYEAHRTGSQIYLPAVPSYRRYIFWLNNQELDQAELFWRNMLQGFASPTLLGIDRRADQRDDAEYRLAQIQLSAPTTSALQDLAQRHRLTLNTIVQGAWSLLLSHYSNSNDVVFGATVSGRPADLPDVETIAGPFINTLPVRVSVPRQAPLLPWLHALQDQFIYLRQYEHTPLVKVHQWSDIPQEQPLFENIFVFENYPIDEALSQVNNGLQISKVQTTEQTNYPLTVVIIPGKKLLIKIIYDRQQFESDVIQRLLGHQQTLLSGMVRNPQARLYQLSWLTAEEKQTLLVDWNNTAVDYPNQVSLPQLFETQAARSPHAVALTFENSSLTYQQLNRRANQLAHALQSRGVGPDVLVGVCLERSLDLVIALLAVLKAGGAYVPIDPSYPAPRLSFMLEDAQTHILLTHEHLAEQLPPLAGELLLLDSPPGGLRPWPTTNPTSGVTPDNAAYMIYTSGSTGRPKGAVNSHRAICNRLFWMQDAYHLRAADRVLQKTPFSFDVSVWEFFWPLITGATLVIARPAGHKDNEYLVDLIIDRQVTTLHFVPSMLQLFLQAAQVADCTSLKRVICSGEALSYELKEQFFASLAAELHNLYGPTEAAIDVSFWPCQPAGPLGIVPIGFPIANIQLYILDPYLQPVPVGVAGELHIGGVGLARGYFNRPALTADKFIPDPFATEPNGRLYKTGDRVRYLPDGAIEFIGRIDFQVKVRGFRIELGEIETTLDQHPAVRQSVVVARSEGADTLRLVAYLVAAEVSVSEFHRFLSQRLPDYMVPSAFVILDALPLTPNGKVDRRALPAPGSARPALETGFVSPRNPLEATLAAIWADVLGLDQVGVFDNFFELGGHSLLVTKAVARIRQAVNIPIPLRSLFEMPTIAQMSDYLSSASTNVMEMPPLVPIERQTQMPLSFAQQRLWFEDQLTPGNPSYNLALTVRLDGRLNLQALEQGISEIIRRHEVLRSTFDLDLDSGKPIQTIHAPEDIRLINADLDSWQIQPYLLLNLQSWSADQQETKVREIASQEFRRSFNLKTGPLLRVVLLRLGPQDHVLLLTMHHIISDGWSLDIFIRELTTLYQYYASGQPPPLPELLIQYVDFAHCERHWLKGDVLQAHMNYWKKHLGDSPPVLDLPTDWSRPESRSFQGSHYTFALDKELTSAIRDLSQTNGVTLFMTLLSAFKLLLSFRSNQKDIVIGAPVANRNRVEIERLIGYFANTLVLRTNLEGNPTFTQLLHRVRQTVLGAYNYQSLPFQKLVEELQPKRDLGRAPLFQVAFTFQNMPTGALETLRIPGLKLYPILFDYHHATFDLVLSIREVDSRLNAIIQYSTDLFKAETIKNMAVQLETLLQFGVAEPETKLSAMVAALDKVEAQKRSQQNEALKKIRSRKFREVKRKPITD